jgi:hypothetical protein
MLDFFPEGGAMIMDAYRFCKLHPAPAGAVVTATTLGPAFVGNLLVLMLFCNVIASEWHFFLALRSAKDA